MKCVQCSLPGSPIFDCLQYVKTAGEGLKCFIMCKVVIGTEGSGPGPNLPHRAAAFNITSRKTSTTLSVIFRFVYNSARQESNVFYTSSVEVTKYYCNNCRCSTVTMLHLESSEAVASVQLPLNSVFFCLVEVFSGVILWPQCSHSVHCPTSTKMYICVHYLYLKYVLPIYSGTSLKGLSVLRTQYKKPPY